MSYGLITFFFYALTVVKYNITTQGHNGLLTLFLLIAKENKIHIHV